MKGEGTSGSLSRGVLAKQRVRDPQNKSNPHCCGLLSELLVIYITGCNVASDKAARAGLGGSFWPTRTGFIVRKVTVNSTY